ncbi:MAG: DUF6263 family protein [bacterium]|nr:DUF6263 family protein [bacterium]
MHRFRIPTVLALTLAAPLTAQDPAGEQQHDLKMSVREGASIWVRQISTSKQDIDMGIQQVESKNVVDVAAELTVTNVADDGMVTIDVTLQRVRGSLGMPNMGEFPFDSIDNDKKPADAGDDGGDDFGGFGMPDFDAIGRAAASIAGTKFVARLDKDGEVKSTEGLKEAVEAMQKRAGAMGGQMLASTFGESALTNLLEAAFGERPKKPMAVGGTWSPKKDDDDNGPATDITMKLARVSDKAFEVTGNGTVKKPEMKDSEAGDDDDPTAAMAREMRKNMEIKNGKITFKCVTSREDGFLIEASQNMSMDVTMESPMGAIEMTQTMSIVTKRTTKGAAMARAGKAAGDAKATGDK